MKFTSVQKSPVGWMATLRLLILFACVFWQGCKKTPEGELHLSGTVQNIRSLAGLKGAALTLEEQVVTGGVWLGTWQTAGTATSLDDGSFSISFQRTNALAYRITAHKEDWFMQQDELSPELWRGQDEQVWSAQLTPKAWIDLAFINGAPLGATASVAFRFLHVPTSGISVCDNAWQQFSSESIPDFEICLMEGDTYLPYTLEVQRGDDEYALVDSVYLPAADTTVLQITF
ncbi:MAG: hypothetical protein ACPGYK_06230 [Flavobacteriales bacterium]